MPRVGSAHDLLSQLIPLGGMSSRFIHAGPRVGIFFLFKANIHWMQSPIFFIHPAYGLLPPFGECE